LLRFEDAVRSGSRDGLLALFGPSTLRPAGLEARVEARSFSQVGPKCRALPFTPEEL
jgi:hypothetical protein